MPMDFPDLKSLLVRFDRPDSVPYKDGETEASYRERCAVFMETKWKDPVEAMEIRSGKGWDRWNDAEAAEASRRHPNPMSNPMLLSKMVDREKRRGQS